MDAEDVTIVDKNKIVIKYDYNITGVIQLPCRRLLS